MGSAHASLLEYHMLCSLQRQCRFANSPPPSRIVVRVRLRVLLLELGAVVVVLGVHANSDEANEALLDDAAELLDVEGRAIPCGGGVSRRRPSTRSCTHRSRASPCRS